ncbi:hypothetical protein PM082_021946 [Marasmius tenuissimus]|nr:hypothetical protein PM082_021946 [Marasmius tenuissimus]
MDDRTFIIRNRHTGPGVQNNNNDTGIQNVNTGGHIGHMSGGSVQFTENRTAPISPKTLQEAVAGIGASHNAEQQYSRGECLEGTREVTEKLRFITTKIVSSPQHRRKFRNICLVKYEKDPDTGKLMVVRDVRTRWNYTHATIRRALCLRKAIDTWTFETSELRLLLLADAEWDLLSNTADMLEIVSRGGKPTISFVLPAYQQMESHLTELVAAILQPTFHGTDVSHRTYNSPHVMDL